MPSSYTLFVTAAWPWNVNIHPEVTGASWEKQSLKIVQPIPQSPKRISLIHIIYTLLLDLVVLENVPQIVCFVAKKMWMHGKYRFWVSLLLFFFCLTALLWSPWSPPLHTPQRKFCDSAFCRAMASAATGRKVKQNRGRAAVDITEGSDISPFKWREKEEN